MGYVDGKNVTVSYRWAKGDYERLPAMASELVKLGVTALVVVGGSPSALAAKAASETIPIVFLIGEDPAKLGLVASFNRPGRNLTGITFVTSELGAKRLGLLYELVPNVGVSAFLLNPGLQEAESQAQKMAAAAHSLGRRLLVLRASNDTEIALSFATLARKRVGALVVQNDPFFDTRRDRIIELAARNAIPAIYHIREFPAAGGLMSYGASLVDAYRQVGSYTGRILNGARPADLPVEQPTKFELVINLKTAKALGLAIPQSMLQRADEVIR